MCLPAVRRSTHCTELALAQNTRSRSHTNGLCCCPPLSDLLAAVGCVVGRLTNWWLLFLFLVATGAFVYLFYIRTGPPLLVAGRVITRQQKLLALAAGGCAPAASTPASCRLPPPSLSLVLCVCKHAQPHAIHRHAGCSLLPGPRLVAAVARCCASKCGCGPLHLQGACKGAVNRQR